MSFDIPLSDKINTVVPLSTSLIAASFKLLKDSLKLLFLFISNRVFNFDTLKEDESRLLIHENSLFVKTGESKKI